MTADEYWSASPYLAEAYRKAHELRNEQINQQLWLQGLYIFNAVEVAVYNAFRKEGTRPKKYIDKPLDIGPKTEAQKEKEAEEERQKIVDQLNEWQRRWENSKKGM